MIENLPSFPPLLNGRILAANGSPHASAKLGAASGELGAGDLIWSEETNRLRFALVLEPDVHRDRCQEMLFVLMVAVGDAAGALIPPEVSITYQWPNCILMNDARIGFVDLEVSDMGTDGVPDWMVVSLDLHMMPDSDDPDPGRDVSVTTMWDEGCGDLTRTELLECVSRHSVAMIHTWSEDGFAPIHELWTGRLSEKQKLTVGLETSGKMVGLDETGNALINLDENTKSMAVDSALDTLRRQATVRA